MFKRFFKKKNDDGFKGEMSPKLILNTEKAIAILAELEGFFTDREVLEILLNNRIDLIHAWLIVIFLPVAFCRHLLPGVAWKDQYYDKAGKVKKLSETETYLAIWQVTDSYFCSHPDKAVIIKIAGRNSEFHVINDLLNAGGKLEEIELTPLCIMI